MPTFYVTFGQKSPFRHGWVEIVADNIETANKEAYKVFGAAGWASVYTEENFQKDLFRAGRLGEIIKLPAGYRHHS